MYPHVMANFSHPIGREYNWRRGNPTDNTVFIDVECENAGAFVSRSKTNELDAAPEFGFGRYYVTRWEYDVAVKYGLISDVKIIGVVDNVQRTNFSNFIVPMYERRRAGKTSMEILRVAGKEDSTEFEELKKQDLFLKYLLNNAYGKFAQNPRNFKEYYYTDLNERPPQDWMDFLKDADDETVHKYSMPIEREEDFAIWAKPSQGRRYNNVGTAASITGAARSILLTAIQHAREPVYCDTDSLVCRDLGVENVDVARLGSWKLEQTFDRVIIAGRKLYACEIQGKPDCSEKRIKVRCKGADLRDKPKNHEQDDADWTEANKTTWKKYEALLDNEIIATINKAPTISKTGHQDYLKRNIRATAPIRSISNARANVVSDAKQRNPGVGINRNSGAV